MSEKKSLSAQMDSTSITPPDINIVQEYEKSLIYGKGLLIVLIIGIAGLICC